MSQEAGEVREGGPGRCKGCRFYAAFKDPAHGVCQRFELWARADGRWSLDFRRRGELRGSEVVVGAGHGCAAFEADVRELQRALLKAFEGGGAASRPEG